MPTVLYRTADLLWASRVRAAAEAAGLCARPVPERWTDGEEAAVLVVELDAGPGTLDLIRDFRARCPGGTVIAFAPHVREDLLRSASKAGAQHVLPRGAVAGRLAALLQASQAT